MKYIVYSIYYIVYVWFSEQSLLQTDCAQSWNLWVEVFCAQASPLLGRPPLTAADIASRGGCKASAYACLERGAGGYTGISRSQSRVGGFA